MHLKNVSLSLLVVLITSCATIKLKQTKKFIDKSISESGIFSSHFTGFVLYDPDSRQYLQEHNADKYFAPASNTKLFTFYAGLKILSDSIPGIKYTISKDSLIFWGTGDPTFLHPDFPDQPVFKFLQNSDKKLYFASGNFKDTHYGAGWAWDDYPYYFQPERYGMPIYGNTVNFIKDTIHSAYDISPGFFKEYTELLKTKQPTFWPNRNPEENIFQYFPSDTRSSRKNRIPFKTSAEMFAALLSDTLNQKVDIIPFRPRVDSKSLYSQRANLVYAWMLKASDNLLAEQILYLCAAEKGDTLNSSAIRAYMIKNHLGDLPSSPVWRDGSGLSRYNLFTPKSMVMLLEKIKKETPEERLLALLPSGGVDGTLKNWYKSDDGKPYVFAKTGTFSNNHTLSGFIRTKSGKLLTFSFMNNNYNSSSQPVKVEMEKILKLIRDKY